ncbi:Tetratricopeptide TPR_1 repeat-containing protein [[Leptolyngbya] sp. PCC 7376]|uniref:CHAT domain-containing protein n=1 Tax=[Leptolyngbya] sp. PCC 7376 TaxID=111781 RepID=UPI00029F100C|nr:CHAT domain-containing protein [[Leptolyngbya] sp. PCC 7376]AFY38360.1 Tetratricopeptide TPR_1 repeat-containing protein [[Leptolyngbya] sp. PCC 7376]
MNSKFSAASLCLSAIACVSVTAPTNATPDYQTFAEWCQNQDQISEDARHTVQVLLGQVGTTDCDTAQTLLSGVPLLALPGQNIRDVRPIGTLTQLQMLLLLDNDISDVSAIAKLTNLTSLDLGMNQITDIRALAPLTNLSMASFLDNPIKQKICPLPNARVCVFSDDITGLAGGDTDVFSLGEAAYKDGDFPSALGHFQDALEIYTQNGDQVRMARMLTRIADTHTNLGNYANATLTYRKSIQLRENLGDTGGLIISYGNLSNLYQQIGQLNAAKEAIEMALVKQEEYNSGTGGFDFDTNPLFAFLDQGDLENNLALVEIQLGNYDAAIASASSALERFEKTKGVFEAGLLGDKRRIAGTRLSLSIIGDARLKQNSAAEALTYFQTALTLAEELGDQSAIASSLTYIGNAQQALEHHDQAIATYEKALEIHANIGNKKGVGSTLNSMGTSLLSQEKLSASETVLLEAIETWEALRPGLQDEYKVSLSELQNETFKTLQQVLIAQGKTSEALAIAERGRARAFIELLATNFKDNPPSTEPPTVEQLKAIAAEQDSTLVEYSIIGDDLNIWVINPTGEIDFRQVDIANQDIDDLVQASRDGMFIEPYYPVDELQALHEILIAPIAEFLPSDENQKVVFIPQGSLFLVPFVALLDAEEHYLIQDHTILTSPSIQALELTRQQKLANAAKKPEHNLIAGFPRNPEAAKDLVLGNPEMPINLQTGTTLSPLSGAEQEALDIADFLKSNAITGKQATKEQILTDISSARIVHIATHGLLEDVAGLGTPGALALAPTETDLGYLTSNEILDLKLVADLVVLSACDTAQGDIKSDGVIGLSRSFIAAGTPSIIVTLWKIPDDSTAFLMQEFYQQLDQSGDKAIALRQAMLATLLEFAEDPDDPALWATPNLWAAPTLIGESL